MISFTRYRKIYFIFSATLILASIASFVVFGFNLGIDFTGGSILEITYQGDRPSNQEILDNLKEIELGTVTVQPTDNNGIILKFKDVDEEIHQQILENLQKQDATGIEEKRFESIGPTIGKELKDKTKIVAILVLLSIVLYIAFAFRKVQRPLRSWQYGIVSILALFHDILIPLGIFSVLGKIYDIEITIPVITAFLAILVYSVNNTVVVFDRIRENLLTGGGAFEDVIDKSLNQTLARQINTSLTTLFVVSAIFILGGETLKYFALALSLGIIAGTYSSFFLAGSILLTWFNRKDRQRKK
jgi:preprotein translocase subunit SecF